MSNPKKHDSGAPEGGRRPTEDAPESSTAAGGGRWSAKRKVSVVLPLLRGADLESTSRKYSVTAATLTAWRAASWPAARVDLRAARRTSKTRSDGGSNPWSPALASKMNCCARRSPAWRTAALWRSGIRNHESHRFAFQQAAVWCGTGNLGRGPGAVQFLRRSPAAAAPARCAKRGPKVRSDDELVAEIREL